jgi:hypothetical protein
VGVPHELAELINLASGLVQLVAAGIGLITAVAVRRRIRDPRRGDDAGNKRDSDLPG